MPAPKQFKPGPPREADRPSSSPPMVSKGRYAVVTPRSPAVVEVSVDDITVVVDGTSKYESRSLHAHGETPVSEPDEVIDVPPEPARLEHTPLGEWRSQSVLEGTRYRRTDSRLI